MKPTFTIGILCLLTACSSQNEKNENIDNSNEPNFYINGANIDSAVGIKKMNFKDGLWEFYSKGELIQKTMYDNGKELYSVDKAGDTIRPI